MLGNTQVASSSGPFLIKKQELKSRCISLHTEKEIIELVGVIILRSIPTADELHASHMKKTVFDWKF